MNHRTKVFFLFCTIALTCVNAPVRNPAHADPYSEHKSPYNVADDSIAQKVIPPKTALPIDDYIIALAAARDANFIADVTSIPKEETIQPFPATPKAKYYHWEPKFYLTVRDMTQQHGMSLSLYDRSTFLFWKEPDAVQLASRLAKEADTDPNEKLSDAVDLYIAVTKDRDLLKNFPEAGKTVDIHLSELPTEQKEKVLTTVRQLFISKESFWHMRPFRLNWDAATVHLKPMMWDAKPVLSLAVIGSYHQRVHETNIVGFQMPANTTVEATPAN
jgi:hypothetical protein